MDLKTLAGILIIIAASREGYTVSGKQNKYRFTAADSAMKLALHQLESRTRESCLFGSEGGAKLFLRPYPYQHATKTSIIFPTKLQAHFAEIQSMTSTTKNIKTSLNVIGCLALLHAIRSNKPPRRTRLRTARNASA